MNKPLIDRGTGEQGADSWPTRVANEGDTPPTRVGFNDERQPTLDGLTWDDTEAWHGEAAT